MRAHLVFASVVMLWVPAVSFAQIPAETAAQKPTKKPGPVTGYSGGDLVIPDGSGPRYGPQRRAKVPDVHMVKKGDSMWSLCERYYGDPWAWPQLWSYNSGITNPHWIYPGDKIRLLASRRVGPDLDDGGDPDDEEVDPPPKPKVFSIKQLAFVEKKALERSTKVIGSPAEKWMLTTHDEMYLDNKKSRIKLRLGKTYSVYRVKKKLYNMKGRLVGYLVLIVGSARVKRLPKDRAALAVIKEAYNSIERGDRVGHLRKLYRTPKKRPAARNLEARIIANLNDTRTVGTDTIVFVDAGKAQGVRPGNKLVVSRRGDGFKTVLEDSIDEDEADPRFPHESTAEILVLDVHEEASVGYVVRARKEIRNGDHARMWRGY